jgi:hypothetical protein
MRCLSPDDADRSASVEAGTLPAGFVIAPDGVYLENELTTFGALLRIAEAIASGAQRQARALTTRAAVVAYRVADAPPDANPNDRGDWMMAAVCAATGRRDAPRNVRPDMGPEPRRASALRRAAVAVRPAPEAEDVEDDIVVPTVAAVRGDKMAWVPRGRRS